MQAQLSYELRVCFHVEGSPAPVNAGLQRDCTRSELWACGNMSLSHAACSLQSCAAGWKTAAMSTICCLQDGYFLNVSYLLLDKVLSFNNLDPISECSTYTNTSNPSGCRNESPHFVDMMSKDDRLYVHEIGSSRIDNSQMVDP